MKTTIITLALFAILCVSCYMADFVDEYQIEECVERYPERFGEWFEIEESELGNHLIVR